MSNEIVILHCVAIPSLSVILSSRKDLGYVGGGGSVAINKISKSNEERGVITVE